MDPMADVSENILSSSMKRRRQSEIVRSSLTVGESTLPIIRQLSNMNSTSDWGRSRDATNFPNLPKPSKQQDRLAGSSSSLIGAIEAYNAKSVFFYKDGDEYFTVYP